MFNVGLTSGHLYGKQLFTWLSLVVSLMASFELSFFPLDVLDEVWDLIESVSEGFLTYSLISVTSILSFSFFLPFSGTQTVRFRLKFCLKEQVIQITNQATDERAVLRSERAGWMTQLYVHFNDNSVLSGRWETDIMIGCVQWNQVNDWKIFHSRWILNRTTRFTCQHLAH